MSPGESCREAETVGFQAAKSPPWTTTSNTSRTGRSIVWVRRRTATSSGGSGGARLAEERERRGVEDGSDPRDLPVPDAVPLADQLRPGRRPGRHVVEDYDLVAVARDVPGLHGLDDAPQPFERTEVEVLWPQDRDRNRAGSRTPGSVQSTPLRGSLDGN